MSSALIICTRIPQVGQTKTRMMPALTAKECYGLHGALLEDVGRVCAQLQQLESAERGAAEVDIFVAHTAGDPQFFEQTSLYEFASFFPQTGSGLGERMECAMKEVRARGYREILMIGADIPEISPEICAEAFGLLRRRDADAPDVVLGPARDGGYYLIGMCEVHPCAFSLEVYSHPQVFHDTKVACEAAGLTVASLEALPDLDTIEDAADLLSRAEDSEQLAPLETVKYLQRCAYFQGAAGTDVRSQLGSGNTYDAESETVLYTGTLAEGHAGSDGESS